MFSARIGRVGLLRRLEPLGELCISQPNAVAELIGPLEGDVAEVDHVERVGRAQVGVAPLGPERVAGGNGRQGRQVGRHGLRRNGDRRERARRRAPGRATSFGEA